MYYEPGKTPDGLKHDPFKSCVVPRPIGWISTVDTEGRQNIAPYSQFQNVTFDPPMPKLNFSAWLGVVAPSGVPASVLDALNKSLVQAVNAPEVKQKLIEVGFAVTGANRADTEKMLKAEAVRWGGIVASSGFKGD